MKQFSIYPPFPPKKPVAGQLLIAEPLLCDEHFARSVILLCEHSSEGSVGFVLNQKSDYKLHDLFSNFTANGPVVYKGGPVQKDTLHLIHKVPHTLGVSMQIAEGIYWGGSFNNIQKLHSLSVDIECDLRLFLGYSGWAPGQLEDEIKEGTWLIANATEEIIFGTSQNEIWKKSISLLGKEYAYLVHLPTDPQLN